MRIKVVEDQVILEIIGGTPNHRTPTCPIVAIVEIDTACDILGEAVADRALTR
jgi:hypothetical protein